MMAKLPRSVLAKRPICYAQTLVMSVVGTDATMLFSMLHKLQWRSSGALLPPASSLANYEELRICSNSKLLTISKMWLPESIKIFLRLNDIIGNTVLLAASARWRHSLMAEEACRPHHQDMREGPWHWSLLLLLVKKKDLLVMLAEEIRGIASSPSWCLAWCSIVKKHLSEIIFDRKFWGEQKIVLVEVPFLVADVLFQCKVAP